MLQITLIYREVKGCTKKDKIIDKSIRDELKIQSIKDKLNETRTKWRKHISKIEEDYQKQ
jgi:hypothetical protein